MPRRTKRVTSETSTYFEDLLASDDEFPDDFHELKDIPAYKLDTRFEEITFPWLSSKTVMHFDEIKENESPIKEEAESLHQDHTPSNCTDNYVKRGVLSKTDINILKIFNETKPDHATILWFVDFLLYKDMLSSFKFLRTCLVSNCINSVLFNKGTVSSGLIKCDHNITVVVL